MTVWSKVAKISMRAAVVSQPSVVSPNAENGLVRGLKLDFDQIMLDIGLLRTRAERPI